MVDYKQILRLRAQGVSQRGIADAPQCSWNTVAAVFGAANAQASGWQEAADLDGSEVLALWWSGINHDAKLPTTTSAGTVVPIPGEGLFH